MQFESAFIVLFAVATAVAVAARRLRIPYTVALVVAGLLLGTAEAFEPPHLTRELLFAIILPGLVFEAAFHLEASSFWKDRLLINSLAIPGVVAAIGLTAALLVPMVNGLELDEGFTLLHALVFAAVIVATDPIAVVALFRSAGVPKRLAVLVEGESLLNDGTGVVLFTLVLGVATGGQLSVAQGILDFLRVAGMGALIGAAIGYAVSHAIHKIDDAMIELTLTMIAAYGSFVAAEHLHYSGVIATVVAGMFCGNWAARSGMSATTRVAVETFWEYLAFALNSVVFLLIGLEVRADALLASWKPIVAAWLAVIAARALVVYGVAALLRRTSIKVPWSWAGVLTWSGLRGAISMVLVLGLPADFPHREVIVHMTFGVVLLSILVQGLTMKPLLRWLKLAGLRTEAEGDYERQQGRVRAAQAALRELELMRQERHGHADVLQELGAEVQGQMRQAEEALGALLKQTTHLHHAELSSARRRVIQAKKKALIEAYQQGVLGEEARDALMAELDELLLSHADPDETPRSAPEAPAAPPGAPEAG